MAIEERMSNCSPVDSGTFATCRIFVRNFRPHSAIAFVSCSGSFVQIVALDVHDGVDDDSAALQCRKRAWERCNSSPKDEGRVNVKLLPRCRRWYVCYVDNVVVESIELTPMPLWSLFLLHNVDPGCSIFSLAFRRPRVLALFSCTNASTQGTR